MHVALNYQTVQSFIFINNLSHLLPEREKTIYHMLVDVDLLNSKPPSIN